MAKKTMSYYKDHPTERNPVTHRSYEEDRANNHSQRHIDLMTKKEAAPAEIKKREDRNRNRAEFERRGLVHKGDHKDIDHIRPASRGGSNSPGNLRVISESANRKKRDK
jgi:hypothetical protein